MEWEWDLNAIAGPPEIPGVTELQPLGVGGMGQVYRGVDGAGRQVAVKVMRRLDPESLARFQREAELLARFRAPEVVTAHAWGTTSRCSYLVCELVHGRRFDEVAAELDLAGRLELLIKVARAAGVAHRGGVVHRDLKPSNVLITDAGEVRLIDFGVSIGLDQERLTRTQEWVGTPAYLPPERLSGAAPDPSADVWSLGAMGFELCTGQLPYRTRELTDLALRQTPPPPLSVPGLPPQVAAVIRRAMNPEPGRRYDDGAALAAALEAAVAGRGAGRGLALALSVVGGALLLGAGLVLVYAARGEAPPAPAPQPSPTQAAVAQVSTLATPVPKYQPPPLESLPIVFREGFARGELSERWEAAGDLEAELVDRQGTVCLRFLSREGSGYINTRPAVVRLPAMRTVRAIAVEMRAPGARKDRPLRVEVLLGGERAKAVLNGTARVTPDWTTFRFELRWMLPHFRAFPRPEELDRIFLRLPGPGEVEVRSISLLAGERMSMFDVLALAYPDQERIACRAEKHFALFADVPKFDDEVLVDLLLASQARLRQTLGAIASHRIPLLLFRDQAGFDAFWKRITTHYGLPHEPDCGTTAAIVNYAAAVYAPADARRLDCVDIAARAFLARNLRMLVARDWLFEGVAKQEYLSAWGIDLATWLAREPRRRVPLKELVTQRVGPTQVWQALLLVRWLEEDPGAPLSLSRLLVRFRDAGEVDLLGQLKRFDWTPERIQTAWWSWVERTFPRMKPAAPKPPVKTKTE